MFRFFEYAKLVFFLDMHKFRAKTFGSSGISRSALNTVLLIYKEGIILHSFVLLLILRSWSVNFEKSQLCLFLRFCKTAKNFVLTILRKNRGAGLPSHHKSCLLQKMAMHIRPIQSANMTTQLLNQSAEFHRAIM